MSGLNGLNEQKARLQDLKTLIQGSEKKQREFSYAKNQNSSDSAVSSFDIENIDSSLLTEENQHKLVLLLGDENTDVNKSSNSLIKNIIDGISNFFKTETSETEPAEAQEKVAKVVVNAANPFRD